MLVKEDKATEVMYIVTPTRLQLVQYNHRRNIQCMKNVILIRWLNNMQLMNVTIG
jgi:hypothetical protein